MGWNAERQAEREGLKRIIALLLSLAVLAERASIESHPVRYPMMDILRFSLTVAVHAVRAFAHDFGAGPQPSSCGVELFVAAYGNGRDDALLLARHLRALAIALACLLAQANCFAPAPTEICVIARRAVLGPIEPDLAPLAVEPAVIDTS